MVLLNTDSPMTEMEGIDINMNRGEQIENKSSKIIE